MSLAAQLGSRFKSALAAEMVKVVAGALLITLLARLLGPDEYGLFFLAISVFSVAKLVSAFGIGRAGSRYIAEFKETDPGQIPHVLKISLGFNVITITVVVVAVVAGRTYLTNLLKEPELSQLLLIGGAFILFSTIWTNARRFLQGFEFIRASSAITASQKIFRLVLALGFVLLGYGAVGALVGYILSSFFAAVVGLVYLFWRGVYNVQTSTIEPGLTRRIVEYSLPIAVTQSAHTIDHHFDKILVGFFIGAPAVAYYTVGKQILSFIQMPMTALGFTLAPTYGSQKAQGNADTAARIYETALTQGLLLYIPAATGVVILAEPGITLIFGQEYSEAVPVLQILSVFALLKAVMKLTSHGLDFLGRARERSMAKVITAALNVVLNIILIPRIGVVGAAISTVITFALFTVFNIKIMSDELNLRWRWILRQIGYAIGVSVIMATTVLPFSELINGFLALFAVVGLGVLVWGLVVGVLGLIDTKKILTALN